MSWLDYCILSLLLLNDPLVFENQYHYDPLLKIMHSEDKINRMLKKLKNDNIITEEEYKHLYASGSTPGTLYGLPKIHKPNIPIRPILSAINIPNYKLAKFLIPSIEHLTKSEYVLKNSREFFETIKDFNLPKTSKMVSFDITSLYTNIPIKETTEIILNGLYNDDNGFRGLSRERFHKLINLIVEDNYFLFNGKLRT